jgi:hypothetical protein
VTEIACVQVELDKEMSKNTGNYVSKIVVVPLPCLRMSFGRHTCHKSLSCVIDRLICHRSLALCNRFQSTAVRAVLVGGSKSDSKAFSKSFAVKPKAKMNNAFASLAKMH